MSHGDPVRCTAPSKPDERDLIYHRTRKVQHAPDRVFELLLHLGGDGGWYFADWLWGLRATIDRWVGGPGTARRTITTRLTEGMSVGMFCVKEIQPQRRLLLEGRMRIPGRASLCFDVEPDSVGSSLSVTAKLSTDTRLGRLYWYSLYPVHVVIFRGMLRALARAALQVELHRPADGPVRPRRPDARSRQLEKPSPCMTGCPNGTNIRGWITTIAQRERLGMSDTEAYEAAWRTIAAVNPFPAITGRICPHPCEAGCNRRDKDGAVSIKELERFIGDWAIARNLRLPTLAVTPQPESIGVVGSGPAGLSFAYQMARRGYRVTIYDRHPAPGGMLRYGIPAYRLPVDVVEAEIGRILDLGVQLRNSIRIGRDVQLRELRDRHAVVFLGIGATAGSKLGIPGELGPGVLAATEYLERYRNGKTPETEGTFVVVGGGDVALDAARTARRTGASVTVVYRRSRTEMPAAEVEIEEALLEQVEFEFLAAPIEIVRNGPRPSAVRARRTRLADPDASGRRSVQPVPGTEFEIPAATVIVATTRATDWTGILRTDGDRPTIDGDGRFEDGLWIGGDIVRPGIAGSAIAHGRRTAEAVHASLRGLPPPESEHVDAVRTGDVRPDDYPARSRVQPASLELHDCISEPDAEIHQGITETQFLDEVERCLSCGSCFGCERCWMYCAHGCFEPLDEVRPGAYFALWADKCRSCGKCVDLCPCGYLTEAAHDGPTLPADLSQPTRPAGVVPRNSTDDLGKSKVS